MRVAVVIATRDRCGLLRQSLAAVAGQSRPTDDLVVVDNASSDGTADLLATEFPHAEVVALDRNFGSSGGYAEGIRTAVARGADWLWLLDDDSFPSPTALEELLAALSRLGGDSPPDLLCGRVEWSDGAPHPVNRPTVRRRDPAVLVRAVRAGLLPVRAATFVCLLVSKEAVGRVGTPNPNFVYQADDIEYTARILRRGRGYYVPSSVVEHRTATKYPPSGDGRRTYFALRNNLFMLRGGSWDPSEKPALAWAVARAAAAYLRATGLTPAALGVLGRAARDGLTQPA